MRQPSLIYFRVSRIFRNPVVEVVHVLHVSLFMFSAFPRPFPCLLPPAPLSGGDMLEVIITTASGFISIYSHNNTEKWKTDSTGVMYYPVRESSFIMTTNRASSLCHHPSLPMHAHTHTLTLVFFSISPSFFPLPSVHPLSSQNPWCFAACKFVPHYHKLW